MKNGHAHDDDEPNDPKISRIEDARRRRQLGLAGGGGGNTGKRKPTAQRVLSGGLKEWLIGGIIIAMAAGFLINWVMALAKWVR